MPTKSRPSPRLLLRLSRATFGLFAVLAVLALSIPATSQATKHPFLWRIDSLNGKPLAAKCWLYGTMHLGDRRLVTLPIYTSSSTHED